MNILKSAQMKVFSLGLSVLTLAVFVPLPVFAQSLTVSAIDVVNIADNSATIKWKTPGAKTSGILYLGESENKFDRSFTFDSYAYDHQITVGGLSRNKTYFYKIIMLSREGERRELFIRSFSTRAMPDTKRPEILDLDVVDNSYGAIVLRWTTNEEASAKVTYGTSPDDLNKSSSVGSYATEQELVLSNLQSGKRYYLKVTARDRNKNETSRTINASVSGSKADAVLKITDLTPISFDSSLISARSARITFKTTLPSKTRLHYGTSLKNMNQKVDISQLRDLKHEVEITGLDPLTTYFFQIEAYGSLYSLKTMGEVLSFETGDFAVRYPSGSLVRAGGDTKVYLIFKNTKAWIESPAVFLGLGFRGDWVQEVPASTLADYQEIRHIDDPRHHPSGSLVKYADKATIYFIEGPAKRPIANPGAFERSGFKWDRVVTIRNTETYVNGSYIE